MVILPRLKRLVGPLVRGLRAHYFQWTTPLTSSLPLQTLADLGRSKSELVAENAILRQQLIILRRQVKRPACTKADRVLLVFLARVVRTWKQALFIVQPETLLRWHRELFRLFCKRTIQKYMRTARTHQPRGQTWTTFLRTHAAQIWACDFLQVTDLFFRSLFAFFLIELKSRKVIHVGVTGSPTDAWVAQQLREATPYGQVPKYLIRDNDGKFGSCFARVATTSAIEILTTPVHAPRANAICERFLRSVRQECLDHLLILEEKQLQHVLNAYVAYFNQARPHQGIQQQIPDSSESSRATSYKGSRVVAVPILAGLHHDYREVA